MNSFLPKDLSPPICQPLILEGWWCFLDRIQYDGIITNKQTAAPCAVLDDPYQSAVVGAVIHIGCVEERIDGPDFNAVPVLKGTPLQDRLLVGAYASSPGRSQCLLIHVLCLSPEHVLPAVTFSAGSTGREFRGRGSLKLQGLNPGGGVPQLYGCGTPLSLGWLDDGSAELLRCQCRVGCAVDAAADDGYISAGLLD